MCYNLTVTKKQITIISISILAAAALITTWKLWPQQPQPVPVDTPAQDENLLSTADIVGFYKEENLTIPRMVAAQLDSEGTVILVESTINGTVRENGTWSFDAPSQKIIVMLDGNSNTVFNCQPGGLVLDSDPQNRWGEHGLGLMKIY